MPLILYPILLIVAVIIFYILGKKSGTEREVIKTVTISADEEVNIYDDENEEQYLLRCQNFIVSFFTKNNLGYLVSDDNSYYRLNFEDNKTGSTYVQVEPYYSNGNKYITCSTTVTPVAIEDHKLSKVAELLNRVNCALLFSGLALDYEDRHVTYKSTYKVGDQRLLDEYFAFHLRASSLANDFLPSINRVTVANEEPVMVALDYLNQ
jgi:hypothetical protein